MRNSVTRIKDDWNEFFASATRLRRGMPRLFESEHGKRFAILQAIEGTPR